MLTAFGLIGAAGAALLPGSFDLISTTVLASNTASVTFDVSSLTSSYKHLQIREMVSGTDTVNNTSWIRFNSDNAANYKTHVLQANGTDVISTPLSSTSGIAHLPSTASGTANVYSPGVIDILDAFSTNKNKTTRAFAGTLDSGISYTRLWYSSGMWTSTAAITSINLSPGGSGPGNGLFKSGSRFSLYGIRG